MLISAQTQEQKIIRVSFTNASSARKSSQSLNFFFCVPYRPHCSFHSPPFSLCAFSLFPLSADRELPCLLSSSPGLESPPNGDLLWWDLPLRNLGKTCSSFFRTPVQPFLDLSSFRSPKVHPKSLPWRFPRGRERRTAQEPVAHVRMGRRPFLFFCFRLSAAHTRIHDQ